MYLVLFVIIVLLFITFAATLITFWPYILFFGGMFYLARYIRDNPDDVKRGFRKTKNMISNIGSDSTCGVCNRSVGFGGGRIVKDGRVCTSCAEYLSPNFQAYDESTLTDIKGQIVERVEFIDSFTPHALLGGIEGIRYDIKSGVIGMEYQEPTDTRYNMEFFRKDQIVGAQLDIVRGARQNVEPTQMDIQEAQENLDRGIGTSTQKEIWRDIVDSRNPYGVWNGRRVLKMEVGIKSPKITKQGYDFYLIVNVDNGYTGMIRYKLNEDPVYQQSFFTEYDDYEQIGNKIVDQLTGRRALPQLP